MEIYSDMITCRLTVSYARRRVVKGLRTKSPLHPNLVFSEIPTNNARLIKDDYFTYSFGKNVQTKL